MAYVPRSTHSPPSSHSHPGSVGSSPLSVPRLCCALSFNRTFLGHVTTLNAAIHSPDKPIFPIPQLKHHFFRKSLLTPPFPKTSLGDWVLCNMLTENLVPFLQNTYCKLQLCICLTISTFCCNYRCHDSRGSIFLCS